MKQIGAEIGVNESRVSQLHARAVQRLKKALGAEDAVAAASPVIDFQKTMRRLRMAKAEMGPRNTVDEPRHRDGQNVLQYRAPQKAGPARRRVAAARAPLAAASGR